MVGFQARRAGFASVRTVERSRTMSGSTSAGCTRVARDRHDVPLGKCPPPTFGLCAFALDFHLTKAGSPGMTFYFIVKSVALAGLARFIILQVPETEVVSVGCRD